MRHLVRSAPALRASLSPIRIGAASRNRSQHCASKPRRSGGIAVMYTGSVRSGRFRGTICTGGNSRKVLRRNVWSACGATHGALALLRGSGRCRHARGGTLRIEAGKGARKGAGIGGLKKFLSGLRAVFVRSGLPAEQAASQPE